MPMFSWAIVDTPALLSSQSLGRIKYEFYLLKDMRLTNVEN